MPDRPLKPGWRWVKFGEVVRLVTDRCADPAAAGIERFVGLEHIDPDDLRVQRWGLVEDGITFTNRFRAGHVLFGKRRAYQRKVALADFDGICSGDIYLFESADPNVLLPGLLPFVCQADSFHDHAVGTSAGSLSPRTNWRALATYRFALPPLDEQRRQAALLRSATDVVEQYDEAQECTVRLKRASRNALMTRGTSPDESPETLGNGNTPAHWMTRKLVEIVTGPHGIVDGPFGSNLKSIHYRASGHPVIRSSLIASGEFIASTGDYVYVDDETFGALHRHVARPGDIIMVLIGINCGACALLPSGHAPGVVSQNCLKISPDNSVVLTQYLLHHLHWIRDTGRLERLVNTTQQRALSLSRMKSVAITLPPIKEQQIICDQLGELDAACVNQLRRRDNARDILKQLMASTFGEA